MHGRPGRSSVSNSSTTQIVQYVFETLNRMSLERLQRPTSKRKKTSKQIKLKLAEQENAPQHFTVTGTSTTNFGNSGVTSTHKADIAIEAHESTGVFALFLTR